MELHGIYSIMILLTRRAQNTFARFTTHLSRRRIATHGMHRADKDAACQPWRGTKRRKLVVVVTAGCACAQTRVAILASLATQRGVASILTLCSEIVPSLACPIVCVCSYPIRFYSALTFYVYPGKDAHVGASAPVTVTAFSVPHEHLQDFWNGASLVSHMARVSTTRLHHAASVQSTFAQAQAQLWNDWSWHISLLSVAVLHHARSLHAAVVIKLQLAPLYPGTHAHA